jgi:phosphonatase-like hydrolase
MSIQLVVFDMAGTTVSDSGNSKEIFREAFLTAGIEVSPEDIGKVMGYKKKEAIKIIVNQYALDLTEDSRVVEDIYDVFIRKMISFYEEDPELQPLPYAESTFRALQDRGIKTALNTDFPACIADPILERLGWDGMLLLDAVICSDEVPEGRPYPYMIHTLMQRLLITDVKSVAKVGDTESDMEEGRNAGCGLVVAVTTGACTPDQLLSYHPDHLIHSLQGLPALIQ